MNDSATTQLPELLARIAEAAGEDAALLVAKALGGRPFYVPAPHDLKGDHRLVELVGLERARAICTELGHGDVILPRGPFSTPAEMRRRVAELLRERKSHAAIALATNLHIRTVEKIAARLRDDTSSQGSLL